MKQNQKGNMAVVAAIIAIIAITAGVIGWKFAKKSPAPAQQAVVTQSTASVAQTAPAADETANWKMYTDKETGVSFKYPSGYEAQSGGDRSRVFVKNPKKDFDDGMSTVYAFEYYDLYAGLLGGNSDGDIKTPEEWSAYKNSVGDINIKTTVAGMPTYVIEEKMPNGIVLKKYNVFVKNGDKYDDYLFVIKKDDVGEKILSTLKFTN